MARPIITSGDQGGEALADISGLWHWHAEQYYAAGGRQPRRSCQLAKILVEGEKNS
jgi:hypothetical protein